MELFKLMGKIVIDNSEADATLSQISTKAKQTSTAIQNSNKTIQSSNKGTGSSWSLLKSKVNEYKSQGMSTSQAWRQASQDMKSSTEESGNSMTGTFAKIGAAVATYLAVDRIIAFGQGCITAAADASAAESQFTQVFGEFESSARKSLSNVASEGGISENRLKGSFTQIAAFAKTTGMDTESALGLSERAMIAVADSAAFYDRSIEDTTESLQSFLKGNYENDAALGLSCTEVTRNEAANRLYGKSFQDLSEAQKQLTLLQMVEDANKASGALGQAARESDTWTNVTGNLQQAWTDFQAVVGSNVLPTATNAVKTMVGVVESWTEAMPKLVNWCKEHETTMQVIGVILGTVATAIAAYNLSLHASAIAAGIATTATAAWGAVMAFVTSPVTLVVAAIGALIAIGIVLYKNWDTIKEKASELFDKLQEVWENIKTAISNKVSEIVDSVKEKFESIKQTASSIFDSVKETISAAWETIKNIVSVGIQTIGLIISTAVQIITIPFRFIWENCKEIIVSAWEAIKTRVSNALNTIKSIISSVWNAIVGVLSPILNKIKSAITTVWNAVKTTVSNVLKNIKSTVTTIWNGIKSTIQSVLNSIKSVVSSIWNSIKSTVSNVLNSIKSTMKSAWNSVKSTVSGAIKGVKSTVSSGLNSAKSTVTSVLNSIKSKFSSIFNSAKSIVSSAISYIKGKFNFSWSLPKLKLPHFKVSGKFSLNPPSVPKFSISWYKKAYDNAMLLNNPTIFGYSAASGKFLGGGDGNGSEVVAGSNTLMKMIRGAVATENDALIYYLQKIIAILCDYFPQVIGAFKKMKLVADDGTILAYYTPKIDKELGRIADKKGRGR